jgi:hypothetical protein
MTVTKDLFLGLTKGLSGLLAIVLALFLSKSEAKPFEDNYEHPEDVAAYAMLTHEKCIEVFPGMKWELDRAFNAFERLNQKYFDAMRKDPRFEKGYRILKELAEDAEITESGCRKEIEVMSSPVSKIEE